MMDIGYLVGVEPPLLYLESVSVQLLDKGRASYSYVLLLLSIYDFGYRFLKVAFAFDKISLGDEANSFPDVLNTNLEFLHSSI